MGPQPLLAHIIAVRKVPAEIREACVLASVAPEKVKALSKTFDTVFILRQFRGRPQEVPCG